MVGQGVGPPLSPCRKGQGVGLPLTYFLQRGLGLPLTYFLQRGLGRQLFRCRKGPGEELPCRKGQGAGLPLTYFLQSGLGLQLFRCRKGQGEELPCKKGQGVGLPLTYFLQRGLGLQLFHCRKGQGELPHLLPAGDGEDWTVVSLKRQKQPSAPGERQGRAVHVLSASRMRPDVSNSLQPGAGFRGAIHILSTRRGGVGRQLYLCGKDRGVESPLTYPLKGGIGRASAMPSGEGREAIAVHLHPVK